MRAILAIVFLLSCIGSVGPISAQTAAATATATATLAGRVVDRANALPVSGARIELHHGRDTPLSTVTDATGRYGFTVVPGFYTVIVRATGYTVSATDNIVVTAGATTVDVALRVSATNPQSTLTTIGHTTTSARALSAATTISRQISVADVTSTGQIRLGDQLGTLPGVNFSTSSSVGDDASINLRGFGSDETAALLDGHPVGPLGVGSGGFNFSLGPAFGDRKSVV